MSEPTQPPKSGPAALSQEDRPMRIVAMFSARVVTPEEIPRLIDYCSKAYAEETPGASLRILGKAPDANIWQLEACPGVMLKESVMTLRLHPFNDPGSDQASILAHMAKLDPDLGDLANNSVEGAVSYLALVGTKLAEGGRIRSFLNAGALIGSALGAMFVDPSAVIVTPDPGEWAEACEQSLSIEGAMGALRAR